MSILRSLFRKPRELELMATMWPSFPHFARFAGDSRISAIRLNTAMYGADELESEFALIPEGSVPMWFDIKGQQLRIAEVLAYDTHLEVVLNHPIRVNVPTMVLFKAGMDGAKLMRLADGGRRLIFDGGPEYMVKSGESLHIRDASLEILGRTFTDAEIEKVAKAKAAGIDKFFLSYVQCQKNVDEFVELVGRGSQVVLKIEDQRGLRFVAQEFRKHPNISLMAARGDLYVELDRPHQITKAMRLIIEKDANAMVGSRIMLSTVRDPVPECSDFLELAWMYDIGYRCMMLCDDVCLYEEYLSSAVDAFEAFKKSYP